MFGFVKLCAPQGVAERGGGASAGIWGAGERGGQPLYPLLVSVEARLIFDRQGLILHAMLSDEVASVGQTGRINDASLCEGLWLLSPTTKIGSWAAHPTLSVQCAIQVRFQPRGVSRGRWLKTRLNVSHEAVWTYDHIERYCPNPVGRRRCAVKLSSN